jgi:hypothetical protein
LASLNQEAVMNTTVKVLQSLAEISTGQLTLLVALAAIGLAAFAIHVVHSLARGKEKKK